MEPNRKKTKQARLASWILGMSVACTGCKAPLFHFFNYHAPFEGIARSHKPYFHSGQTGKIIEKDPCATYCEPACYGFEPTCWTPWPSECPGNCPVPASQEYGHEVVLNEQVVGDTSTEVSSSAPITHPTPVHSSPNQPTPSPTSAPNSNTPPSTPPAVEPSPTSLREVPHLPVAQLESLVPLAATTAPAPASAGLNKDHWIYRLDEHLAAETESMREIPAAIGQENQTEETISTSTSTGRKGQTESSRRVRPNSVATRITPQQDEVPIPPAVDVTMEPIFASTIPSDIDDNLVQMTKLPAELPLTGPTSAADLIPPSMAAVEALASGSLVGSSPAVRTGERATTPALQVSAKNGTSVRFFDADSAKRHKEDVVRVGSQSHPTSSLQFRK